MRQTIGRGLSVTGRGVYHALPARTVDKVYRAFMDHIWTGLIFVAIGAAGVAVAFFSWLNTRRFVAESVAVSGEVVGLLERDGDGVTYSPVIRFPGPGGRPYEFTETTSSSPPGYSVGDRVEVLYHSQDPKRARVASPFRLYLLEMIFGSLGTVFFIVGLLVAVFG